MSHFKGLHKTMSYISTRNLLASSRHLLTKGQHSDIHHSCKILVVGGGTAGCTMAAKFTNTFNTPANQVIVVEPNDVHYYQPLFTLVGGGLSRFESTKRPMKDVLPMNAKWLKDSAIAFEPEINRITTSNGDTVQYDIMIVALGLQLYWENIPGLVDGLRDPKGQVCSIYGPDTVTKVFRKIYETKNGTTIFTFPNTPVKCPGAPQKILYLAEEHFRNHNVRDEVEVVYNTALPVIFGVKKYADSLWGVCKSRNIKVNLQTNLVEIDVERKEAKFQNLAKPEETFIQEYSLLHVTPHMGPPEVLKKHPSLTNEVGFLSVDSGTLRHTKYSNVYGIGDCTNTPNSKTMAAVAAQGKVLYRNILDDMSGKPMSMTYNGYASCPLVTGNGKCILAEFDYNLQPLETFPVNQGKEYFFAFVLKKIFFPFLYWNLMLKGLWDGPEFFRKFSNLVKETPVTEIGKR